MNGKVQSVAVLVESADEGAEGIPIDSASRAALELAVDLASRLGVPLTAISLGGPAAEAALAFALARGATRAIQALEAPEPPDPIAIARQLADILRGEGVVVAVAGDEGSDGSSAVPQAVAAYLGVPHVVDVEMVDELDAARAVVRQRRPRGGRRILAVALPAVLVATSQGVAGQYVSVRRLREAMGQTIERRLVAAVPEGISLAETVPYRPRTKRVQVADSRASAADRLKALITGDAKAKSREEGKRTGGVFELPPEEAARKLVQFLEEKGFLTRHGGGPV